MLCKLVHYIQVWTMVTSVMTLTAISLERLVPPNIFSGYTRVCLEIYGKLCHSVFYHHFIAGNGIENRVRLDGNCMIVCCWVQHFVLVITRFH